MWNEQIVVTCGVLHANEVKYMFTVLEKKAIWFEYIGNCYFILYVPMESERRTTIAKENYA
jgi:hypothetical protein